MELMYLHSLSVDILPKLLWYIFVEFLLNETGNGLIDTFIDLTFDFLGEVLQHLVVQCIIQQFFDLLLFTRLCYGECLKVCSHSSQFVVNLIVPRQR